MLIVKAVNSGLFFLVILFNYFFIEMTLNQLVIALIIINGFTSLTIRWDGKIHYKGNIRNQQNIIRFWKIYPLSHYWTNLLRSADTLIISLSPMGSCRCSLQYPFKTNRITTNSFTKFCCNSIPKDVKASLHNQIDEVKAYSIPIQVR
jgi:hypothetical protein